MERKRSRIGLVVLLIVLAIVGFELVTGIATNMMVDSITNKKGQDWQESTYRKIDYTPLTKEQRLEDFDYFYRMIKTTLPSVYDMDDKYGFSVLDREEEYRRMVSECEDDYSFLALMSSVINDIPSGHASFYPPDYYGYFTSGYYRADTVGITLTENMHGKLDAYAEYLVDMQKKYNALLENALYFTYADGSYLCTGGDYDLFHATIVSINGGSADEFISSTLSPIAQVQYDTKNEKAYRSSAMFSSAGTQPAALELELADGSRRTVEYYCDYDLCYALEYGYYFTEALIEDLQSGDGELFEGAPAADEDAVDIQTDEQNGIAYVSLSSVMYSEGSAVKNALEKYADYDNIVIDLRGNGGGVSSFYEEYVYPALYKQDAEFEAVGYVPKNEYTKGLFNGFIGGLMSRWYNNLRFGVTNDYPSEMYDCNDGSYYKYSFTHELNGNSELKYSDERNVYYIVNQYTCSAADEIVQMVKECGLGTVVGTNTLGEGLIFGVCCDWLPNSLLMYMYCPTYAVDSEGYDNSLYGTQPDIYGGTTVEGYILSDIMELNGENWQSLENRELWDNNYRLILQDIGALDMAA